jgi:transcriptional regulator with XRE-family HTH domain
VNGVHAPVSDRDREIGRRIQRRRWDLGLSIRQVETPGVGRSQWIYIENGQRRATLRALRLIAPRLGVSVHWLETGEPDPVEVAIDSATSLAAALAAALATLVRPSGGSSRLLVGATADREETT